MTTPKRKTPDGFQSLATHYAAKPIVLYVGAGISSAGVIQKPDGTAGRLGLPLWIPLLEQLASVLVGTPVTATGGKVWKKADAILDAVVESLRRKGKSGNLRVKAEEKLQHALSTLVQSEEHFTTQGKGVKRYKLLRRELLEAATTLRAVIALCTRPTGRSAKTGRYLFGANPRIRAVLSGNYDPFLEAGATAMFIKPVLKPVAAIGSLAGDLRQVPVFHFHGYVPHPGQADDDLHQPVVNQLVLSRKSYARAWQEADVFSATMVPQVFLLRHYTNLFIGFSFTDPMVNRLLRRLHQANEVATRQHWHYSVERCARGNRTAREKKLEKLGVRPLFIDDYDEIPLVLKALYEAGVKRDCRADGRDAPVSGRRGKTAAVSSRGGVGPAEPWNVAFTAYQGHFGRLGACPREKPPSVKKARHDN